MLARPCALAAFALAFSCSAPAPQSDSESVTRSSEVAPALARANDLLLRADLALTASDTASARSLASEASDLLARDGASPPDAQLAATLVRLGKAARDCGDVPRSRAALERALALQVELLGSDHVEVQRTRTTLGSVVRVDGDLPGARLLVEAAVEALERTQPPECVDLQLARMNLASILRGQGDARGALILNERAAAELESALPADDVRRWRAQAALAAAEHGLGESANAESRLTAAIDALTRIVSDEDPDLVSARTNLATMLYQRGDLDGAIRLQERLLTIQERRLPRDHPTLRLLRQNLANTAGELGDFTRARALQEDIVAACERTRPPGHPDLLAARLNLAGTLYEMRDLAAARELLELALDSSAELSEDDYAKLLARICLAQVLELQGSPEAARISAEQAVAGLARTVPAEHRELLRAREVLAGILSTAGDQRAALQILTDVVLVRERSLPEEHPDRLSARMNLARALYGSGDASGARTIQEDVLAIRLRVFPPGHPQVQRARTALAATLEALGALDEARELEDLAVEAYANFARPDDLERIEACLQQANTMRMQGDLYAARDRQAEIVSVLERVVQPDHVVLLRARQDLASSLLDLGDTDRARAIQEDVLAERIRTRGPDDFFVQQSRSNLALTLRSAGDIAAAVVLQQEVLTRAESAMPDGHPVLQVYRSNLAGTLLQLGDRAAARALLEKALAVEETSLPAQSLHLARTRQDLAEVLSELGEYESARRLQVAVLQVREAVLVGDLADHPSLAIARLSLGRTLRLLGDLDGARTAGQRALDDLVRALPEGHTWIQSARIELASTWTMQGEWQAALELQRAALDAWERVLPDDHADLQAARGNVCRTLAHLGLRDELAHVLERLAHGVGSRLDRAATLPPRAADEAIRQSDRELGILSELGPAAGLPSERLFGLAESARARSVAVAGSGAAVPADLREVADAARTARRRIDALVRRASTRVLASGFDLAALVRERDRLEGELYSAMSARAVVPLLIDAGDLARALEPGACAIGFRQLPTDESTGQDGRLVAHVVSRDAPVRLVDLCDSGRASEAVQAWRTSIGKPLATRGLARTAASAMVERDADVVGAELRRVVLDPLLAAIGDARVLHVCLDGPLELVSLDVLPLDDGVVGDRYSIHIESSFSRLLAPQAEAEDQQRALVLGDVDYDALPVDSGTSWHPDAFPPERAAASAAVLDGIARWPELAGTRTEALAVRALFQQAFQADALVLARGEATTSALQSSIAGARWVHIATHGWFAPDSVRGPSGSPSAASTWKPMSLEQAVTSLAPMTLCGLVLAGANHGTGLLTAEEIAGLDLSRCELAVLSACETNVGIERAGQGLQSMQAALHSAGARSTITSLWQVDDAATAALFQDFYDRVWLRGQGKSRALWHAKQALRKAGHPPRDWAGWVLIGDPL